MMKSLPLLPALAACVAYTEVVPVIADVSDRGACAQEAGESEAESCVALGPVLEMGNEPRPGQGHMLMQIKTARRQLDSKPTPLDSPKAAGDEERNRSSHPGTGHFPISSDDIGAAIGGDVVDGLASTVKNSGKLLGSRHGGALDRAGKPGMHGEGGGVGGGEEHVDYKIHIKDEVTPRCNLLMNASQTQPSALCPEACPYWAEMVDQERSCVFQCVTPDNCGRYGADPKAVVADESGYCRRCSVPGCMRCDWSVHDDVCAECSPGYMLKDGQCKSVAVYLWAGILAATIGLLIFLTVYLGDLLCRASVNEEGVAVGQLRRALSVLRMPHSGGYWPLTTNTLSVPVGGRGTVLLFNFQMMIILWSFFVALGWYAAATFISPDLFTLGLLSAFTPRQYCTVIHWGYMTQHQLMYVKYTFCIVVYLLSCVGALAYAVYHRRRFNQLDSETTSMMDFAAFAVGLPHREGTEEVEKEFKEFFASETGQPVIGVSVCWDYSEDPDAVVEAVDKEFFAMEEPATVGAGSVAQEEAPVNCLRRFMNHIDGLVGGILGVEEESASLPDAAATEKMLRSMTSTSSAFVVFASEEARDAAVALSACQGGLKTRDGSVVTLKKKDWEPESILFENFQVQPSSSPACRIALGSFAIFGALMCWCVFFFLPTALYISAYTEVRGEDPGLLFSILLTVLVILGNQIIYFLCDYVGTKIGFRSLDDHQVFYVVSYTLACVVAVALDICLLAYSTYHEMVNLGIHTDKGSLIEMLKRWEEIFEAYAMQKSLGQTLYGYMWPATFLVPFLAEPLGTIMAPYLVQKWILSSKPRVKGYAASKSLAIFIPMDLSRYGDVLLNVTLASMIVFVPPGFLFNTFLFMALSHIFIIGFDHIRVLRFVSGFCYPSNRVDNMAQMMLSIPLGIILSGVVFKSNCQPGLPCAHGFSLLFRCLLAFFGHIAVHLLVFRHVVPLLARGSDHEQTPIEYPDYAKDVACSWFTANPVHCLRSKYIYKEKQPCIKFERGMERHMVPNPRLGIYYSGAELGAKLLADQKSVA
eukprot:TRINITY_DN27786_c0_g1_i1.p1 TRINITY_DN27786_c0_g1~~TRINITY_DN27786_c0_g1_i1.p1  ORF type:complete len:1040 (+),score=133.98 TRINITY_DN27786_c0_g1_i1:77-3196(+)